MSRSNDTAHTGPFHILNRNGERFESIDHETETETETMTSNAPTGPIRIVGKDGKRITPETVGYQPLSDLWIHVADLWTDAKVVRFLSNRIPGYEVDTEFAWIEYNDGETGYDNVSHNDLPKHLLDAIRELNLDGVQFEF